MLLRLVFLFTKASVSIDQAADPTSLRYKCLTFLLNSEILGEIVEFGLHDSVPEVGLWLLLTMPIL